MGRFARKIKRLDSGRKARAKIACERFPVLGAYELCLKCSHLFNILDARGAISVTERVGVIARVRALAVGIAKAWVDQQTSDAAELVCRGVRRADLWATSSRRRKKSRCHP